MGDLVSAVPEGDALDAEIQGLYGTAGVPESFVVGVDGMLIVRRLGADDWFSENNRTLISTLLRDPAGRAR